MRCDTVRHDTIRCEALDRASKGESEGVLRTRRAQIMDREDDVVYRPYLHAVLPRRTEPYTPLPTTAPWDPENCVVGIRPDGGSCARKKRSEVNECLSS
jgi:hypothetical protein